MQIGRYLATSHSHAALPPATSICLSPSVLPHQEDVQRFDNSQSGTAGSPEAPIVRLERIWTRSPSLGIAGWLGVPLEELTPSQDEAYHQSWADTVTTPETVARVLRADDSLGPEEVETLMITFRALYTRMQDQRSGRAHSESEASTSSTR